MQRDAVRDHLPYTQDRPAARPDAFAPEAKGEEAWIEVISKMDSVYADLIQSQTLLEQQNAALEETQRFIANVLGAMTDVLVACDQQGRIQEVNQALLDLTGETEASIVGRKLSGILHDPDHPTSRAFLDKVRLGEPVEDMQIELRDRAGHGTPLSANGSAILNYRGKRIGMVIVGRPDGELRRAYRALDIAHQTLTRTQQQLVVSEKMAALGRVVAGVAHELNNPISFIFGNVHALQRYCVSLTTYLDATASAPLGGELARLRESLKIDAISSDMAPLIEGTMEGAERVRAIVEDLRRFSSNQREHPETFDVIRLLRTALDWVARAERFTPELRFSTPEQFDITFRKGHLHQVLVNLVQNAFDAVAGRHRPSVEITTEERDGILLIEIADNGTGIAEENLGRIFEPFFTTKQIGKGTGLGLYVSYGLIRENGGDIAVANRPTGGAVFTVTIPLRPSDG